MFTPVPLATSSSTSNSNGNANAENTSTTTTRRRGSSLNMLLNHFGIRPNSNHSTNPSTANSSAEALPINTVEEGTSVVMGEGAHRHPHHRHNNNELNQLPISLSLTAPSDPVEHGHSPSTSPLHGGIVLTNTNEGAPQNNENITNTYSLKNLRHFIYGADQPNANDLLQLQLPADSPHLPVVDEKTIKQRKDKNGLFSLRLTPFVDTTSASHHYGLFFDPVIRTAGSGSQLVIGRYTERVRESIAKIPEQFHPVVFKSKVVSRTHGCFKVDSSGNWFIKDVKSSSGTFLNNRRLSPASTSSSDILLHDGDILQLGMDFRGGTEEIYRCVKMKVELNRSWRRKANNFNKEALQKIKNIQKLTVGNEEEDCSICLSKIKPCQAIFISPCAHNWHYHCIRRLVTMSYPQFICPNCRRTCDLEALYESSDSESEGEMDLDENDDENDVSIAEGNGRDDGPIPEEEEESTALSGDK